MSKKQKKPSFLINLLCNIILPSLLLEKGDRIFGADHNVLILILSLALPLGYAAWDYIEHRHKNYISILGAVNVLGTGGFALMEIEGIWFAIKEAFFPFILGIGVLASEYFTKPFFVSFLKDSHALNFDKILAQVDSLNRKSDWNMLIKNANRLFALSFFVSSGLNFLLAKFIFKPIPTDLEPSARTLLLNAQIAEMTWKGYIVIALPLLIFMMLVFWYLLRGIYSITGLKPDDVLNQSEPASASSSGKS